MDARIGVYFAGFTPGRPTLDLFDALNGIAPSPADRFARRFLELHQTAPTFLRATSLETAEIVVHPHRFEPGVPADRAAADAKSHQLPCIFLSWGDDPSPVSVPYGIVYRHSLFRSRQLPCERAIPAIAEDSLAHLQGQIPFRPKSARPTVGFRGYCGTMLSRTLYTLSGRFEKVRGLRLRARLLAQLKKSPRIDTRFEPQTQFLGAKGGPIADAEERARRARQDFIDNLLDADYTLCVRGGGNFSYRFYEVLSAARVPLFVDTDCVLPFNDLIDWKQHVIWVDEKDIVRIGQIVADFHEGLSNTEAVDLQRKNRTLWQQYLTASGFWRQAIASAIAGNTGDAARTIW